MRLLILTVLLISGVRAGDFDTWFTGATLRVDYFHSGTAEKEYFALDAMYKTGTWSGARVERVTPLNLGEYQIRMYDVASGTLLYSRGYSTLFNEWQTTAEAKKSFKTVHESWRVPMPRKTVRLTVARRDKQMRFREIWSTEIDPALPHLIHDKPHRPAYKVWPLMQNGDPSKKVDIVILGDGYTKEEMEQFRRDARHYNTVMFDTEPFKSHRKAFNVWVVEVISPESGISKPDKGIWKDNALGCAYFTFGSPRYILTENNKALRDAAGLAPYDYINILVNDNRYGGGGIYNLYTTTYMRVDQPGQEWQMDYVYVHEFGHAFAGLGDEYYSSSTGYDAFYSAGVEPWEPNVTALLDKNNIKWKEFITPGIEIPTPWNKKEYDRLASARAKLDRLAPDYYVKREPYIRKQHELLAHSPFAGKVGAFEGAGYESRGLYRPSVDCRMFSLSLVDFDPVCNHALVRVIQYLSQ
ncbi:MAG: peptidase M64 [Calditrichaeota bacterium]|nr:MAG: peptidase M64 [Calditrichota bacterium]